MKDKYNEILKSAKELLYNMDTDEFLDKFLKIQESNKEKDMFVIDIAKDFSQLPQGRYHSDNPDNAEALFILIQDVLDYEDSVELRFNDTQIAAVGSSFLDQLARMVVTWSYQDIVMVTSDNDWVVSRYEKYLSHWEQQGDSK